MKLKCLPEDFQVEELTHFEQGGGRFALYRLTKRSLGTPEAIEAISRRWNISRRQISYGGLKDRHAVTVQWLTIERGPRRDLEQSNLTLAYVGQASRPFEARDIAGNRFQIVLRSLDAAELDHIQQALPQAARDGVPNYFDDQRFGSLTAGGEFMAQAWCLGDYERALWLALAEPNPHDQAEDREIKETLRSHWGDWPGCKAALPRSSTRSIITLLADRPGDFRRAVGLLRPDLRSLYLAAFQSYVWNRLLAETLRLQCTADELFDVQLAIGALPFYRDLEPDRQSTLASLELPLPSARLHLEPGPMQELLDQILAELGLELRQMRVKYPRDAFFSKGSRRAILVPEKLTHESQLDEVYAGCRKLLLTFDLPRGSYATMLVKRITTESR